MGPIFFLGDMGDLMGWEGDSASDVGEGLWCTFDANFGSIIKKPQEICPDVFFHIGINRRAENWTFPVVQLAIMGEKYCQLSDITPKIQRVILPTFRGNFKSTIAMPSFLLSDIAIKTDRMPAKKFQIWIVSLASAGIVQAVVEKVRSEIGENVSFSFDVEEATESRERKEDIFTQNMLCDFPLDRPRREPEVLLSTVKVSGSVRGPNWLLVPSLIAQLGETFTHVVEAGDYVSFSWSIGNGAD